MLPRACELFDKAYELSWDHKHGGLIYGYDLDGKWADTDKCVGWGGGGGPSTANTSQPPLSSSSSSLPSPSSSLSSSSTSSPIPNRPNTYRPTGTFGFRPRALPRPPCSSKPLAIGSTKLCTTSSGSTVGHTSSTTSTARGAWGTVPLASTTQRTTSTWPRPPSPDHRWEMVAASSLFRSAQSATPHSTRFRILNRDNSKITNEKSAAGAKCDYVCEARERRRESSSPDPPPPTHSTR